MASVVDERPASAASAAGRPRAEKSTRSRRSTGAVRWLIPTSSRCMRLKVVALRQKIADRHEIQQHDRETNRGKVGRPAATPANTPRREKLEGVYEPADERDENLRVLQRHR